MVVLREIKWNILCVDLISVAHVVSDNINHHPDVSSMGSFNESFQTSFITKVFVNLCEVLCSISVVLIRVIIRNRGDPNCIETEILNVVKIVFDSLEVTTAVVWLCFQVAFRGRSSANCKSICDQLVDVP